MPTRAKKYCSKANCGRYAVKSGMCQEHYDERQREVRGRRVYQPYERWYGLKVWRVLKERQLRRQPLCEECLKEKDMVVAEEVDHIKPHRGDWRLFIDPNNLQSLCASCHSRKTAKENAARGKGG